MTTRRGRKKQKMTKKTADKIGKQERFCYMAQMALLCAASLMMLSMLVLAFMGNWLWFFYTGFVGMGSVALSELSMRILGINLKKTEEDWSVFA